MGKAKWEIRPGIHPGDLDSQEQQEAGLETKLLWRLEVHLGSRTRDRTEHRYSYGVTGISHIEVLGPQAGWRLGSDSQAWWRSQDPERWLLWAFPLESCSDFPNSVLQRGKYNDFYFIYNFSCNLFNLSNTVMYFFCIFVCAYIYPPSFSHFLNICLGHHQNKDTSVSGMI